MRRWASLVAVVALLGMLVPASLSARQSPAAPGSAVPPATVQPPQAQDSGKNPYGSLFKGTDDLRREALKQRAQAALRAQQGQGSVASGDRTQPWVVCGMTIIPVDPSIDPEMLVRSGRSTIEHKMRVIEPPVCFSK